MSKLVFLIICFFSFQAFSSDRISLVSAKSCASESYQDVLASFSNEQELASFKNLVIFTLGDLYREQRAGGFYDARVEAEYVEALESCYKRTLGI